MEEVIKDWTDKEILALRERLEMTQAQIASRLRVAVETVSKWELGKTRPDIHNRKKLNRLERRAVRNGKTL